MNGASSAPQRRDMDERALALFAERGEIGGAEARRLLGMTSGNASRLYARLVRTGKAAVRREDPPQGKYGPQRCFYSLAVKPDDVNAVIAKVWANRTPQQPVQRISSVFHLGAALADKTQLEAQC